MLKIGFHLIEINEKWYVTWTVNNCVTYVHILCLVTGSRDNRWSMVTVRMGMCLLPVCVCVFLTVSLLFSLSLSLSLPLCLPPLYKNSTFLALIWNYLFLYIALAIYCQSPAAFEALSIFKLLQLPGVYTLKSFIRSNKDTGECANRLAHEGAICTIGYVKKRNVVIHFLHLVKVYWLLMRSK